MKGSMLCTADHVMVNMATVGVSGSDEFVGIALSPDVDISDFLHFLPSLKLDRANNS
jgi:hypothetical protein